MKITGFLSVSICVKDCYHCNLQILVCQGKQTKEMKNYYDGVFIIEKETKIHKKFSKSKENVNLFQRVQLIQKYTVNNFDTRGELSLMRIL